MLVSLLPSFDMSSLRRKAKCIIINFLVFWSICQSSFLVHFQNSPENLRRVNDQMFILLMRFLFLILVSTRFLVCLGFHFQNSSQKFKVREIHFYLIC